MCKPAPRRMARDRRDRARALLLALSFVVAGVPVGDAPLAATHKVRHSKIVPPSRAAPDITATIPKRATPPKAAPIPAKPDDETLPPPFYLPNAPRSRMRACGEQWQAVKLSGHAGSKTWRDFATKCLAGPAEPARTIP